MSISEAIILGAVQGLTEFLPISSSGHLILAREVLGMSLAGTLAFDVMLHLATLAVIFVYFHRILGRLALSIIRYLIGYPMEHEDRMLVGGVIVGTIPAVIVGGIWGDFFTDVLRHPLWVVGALVLGSAIFWIAERYGAQNKDVSIRSGFIIGLFQVLAFIPGMSRSGITIAGGLFSGISRKKAAEFSFILAVPAIAGAGLLQALNGDFQDVYTLGLSSFAGAITAFWTGLLAVHFLMKFVQSHRLDLFIWYRLLLAGGVLLFLFVM